MTPDRDAATASQRPDDASPLEPYQFLPQSPALCVVSRAGLIERARESGRRIVGITAPAGYGKTTVLAQWAEIEDRPVSYVSFGRFDDDPARLVTLLASAYARIPGVDQELVADVSGPGVSVLGRAATRLAAALRTSSTQFVLMLDDVHELRVPACQDVLGLVVESVPDASQLVLTSRAGQPYLPRLQAAGTAMELGTQDLMLDPADAQEIFAAHDLHLDAEQASRVTQRVEGWPVGISLAALIARGTDREASAIGGDDPLVADYLYQEALAQVPDGMRTFLRRTAVLEEVSGPLCDAVLLASGSARTLWDIERARLFIVPVDGNRGWYRYHALLREFLLSELRRTEPELIPDLHARAADWYVANGVPDRAVENLLVTPDRERCAQLISELALTTYQTGQMSTLDRWLAELGDTAIREHPPLASVAGMMHVLDGATNAAERWMDIVDGLEYDGVPGDGTASFESSRAILRAMMCRRGPEQMLVDARLSLDREPAWSLWRDTALDLHAEALLLAGERDQASVIFEEATALAAECGNTDSYVVAESELSILALERGESDAAIRHADGALAAMEEHRMHDYAISVVGFASAARATVQRGDLGRARRLLEQGMRARQYCTAALPYLAVRARLHLARVSLALSDPSAARHLLREINDIVRRRPRLGALIEEVDAFRDELSSVAVRTHGRPPLSAAELRVLPYLQTHLTVPDIADRLFVSRNTVRTQVASIYRKLDATSRAEAVANATEVGLLGG